MKRIFSLSSVILFTLVLSGCSWQEMFQQEKTKFVETEIQKQEEQTNTNVGEVYFGIDTSNWQTYTNAKYGYSLKYPQNWLKQGDNNMVSISDNRGADITIYRSGLKAEENLDETLEQHLKRMYDYYIDQAENHDGNAIYARPYDINNYESYEVNGYPAYKSTSPISMDSKERSLFVKLGKNILAIKYTEANANIDNFATESLPTIYKILDSLIISE